MLYRSGENLLNATKIFCEEAKELWLYSPFIRVNKLKEVIVNPKKCNAIVVRWQTMDILVGVTDFEELYQFCVDNDISLYRNTKIHLKVIRNEKNHIFYGSANLTNMGLGLNGNLELSGVDKEKHQDDINYLNNILCNSTIVDKDYFEALHIDILEKKKSFKKIEKVEDKDIQTILNKKFLLDTLPQSDSPTKVWLIFESNYDNTIFSDNEILCAKHDIQSYIHEKIESNTNKETFFKILSEGFNTTLFISELKSEIRKKFNYKMGYTEITQWISKTTLSVPTPSRHDIKDKKWVNRLHNWIPFLDQDNFKSEKRHISDGGSGGTNLLHYIGNDHANDFNTLSDLMDNLRVNHKGGKSPHQYILLATINEFVKNDKQEIQINEIEKEFYLQWPNAQYLNSKADKNLAMPLNALKGKLIKFNYLKQDDHINNYRSEIELKEKVRSVIVGKSLFKLFNSNNFTSNDILEYY